MAEQRKKLSGEIDYLTEQITFLTEEIKKKDIEIKENEKRLTEINAELDIQRDFLSDNLRILYEEEQVSFWERLFTAKSISEVFSEDAYLDSVREKLTDITNRIAALKEEEEQKRQELEEDRKIQEVMRASLALQKAESENTLEKVEKEELIIREKFSQMLSRSDIRRYCAGEGEVIKAKYPIFRFPVECGYISQGYGKTAFASIDNAYNGAIHNGFDVGVKTGTPIYAIGNGEVFTKGKTPSGGWGNYLIIKHDPVTFKTGQKDKKGNDIETTMQFYSLYAHLVSESHIALNERVDSNTVIGFVGGTPYWAPHLHLSLFLSASDWADGEIGNYPGNTIDPLNYMDIPISITGTDWDVRYAHF